MDHRHVNTNKNSNLGPFRMTPEQIRDQLLAYTDHHEEQFHGKRVCPMTRLNVIAFLAHALGVRTSEHFYQLRVLIDDYDVNCPCGADMGNISGHQCHADQAKKGGAK